MLWFTSDTHFGHANIIKYCNRPFASVGEMDALLIHNINEHIAPNDTLYHLGDFSFRGGDPGLYRDRIACRNIVLVLGNHDPQSSSGYPKESFAAHFKEVHQLVRIKVPVNGETQRIVLCHYAMKVWNKSHHGAWHLYGHSHGTLPDDPHARAFDVGVDCHGYRPLNLDEVTALMAKKEFRPIDHHGASGDD